MASSIDAQQTDISNGEAVKAFFEGWEIYQTVIERNYMLHEEIIAVLAKLMPVQGSKCRVLEFGCGDAHVISQVVTRAGARRPELSYCGVDLAAQALEFARKNLQVAEIPHDLRDGDMLEVAARCDKPANIILSGFTFHHLNSGQKRDMLIHCRRLLAPGGRLIFYDVMHREDETRDDFIDRYMDHVYADWMAFNEARFTAINRHIRSRDFPISISAWQALGEAAGFTTQQCHFRDANDFYALLELRA